MDIEGNTADQIEIIYEDEYIVAINKEAGLLVHRTERKVTKQYVAVVRGFMSEQGTVDYALSFKPDAIADKFANLDKPAQEAVTHWQSLAQIELPFAVSKKHATSRYSLVRLTPETGRKHQLRRHMRHVFHHIVGDTSHGDIRHTRFFRMLLHAQTLALSHPVTGEPLLLKAGLDDQWMRILEKFSWVDSAKD